MELLKGLLKWIILAILIILVVVLVIKYANNNTTSNNQTKEPTVNIVNQKKQDDQVTEEPDEDGLVPIEENQTVNSPDTASTGVKEMLIGITIISIGLVYIQKQSTIKGNA